MAKISTYSTTAPVGTDLLLGTDEGSSNATKNFTVSELKTFISGQYHNTVSLSKADILALHSTPITVVAAPGANKILVPDRVLIQIIGTNPYAGATGIAFSAGGDTFFIGTSGVVLNSTLAKYFVANITTFPSTGGTSLVANSAITVTTQSGAAATDTGTSDLTLTLTMFYYTMDI